MAKMEIDLTENVNIILGLPRNVNGLVQPWTVGGERGEMNA